MEGKEIIESIIDTVNFPISRRKRSYEFFLEMDWMKEMGLKYRGFNLFFKLEERGHFEIREFYLIR